MKNINYSLYFVTGFNTLLPFEECLTQAIEGGTTIIQLREKDLSSKEFYTAAKKAKEITRAHNIPLIINDRLDIGLAIDADGVHLGQDDLPCHVARSILGPDKILGISVFNQNQAKEAALHGADYIGVGAMFPTGTKKDHEMVSFEELKNIRQATNLPIIVIGGINKSNIAMFKDMDINGVAVVSAISESDRPKEAAGELVGYIKSCA